jgi:hypothetical protein
MTRFEERGKEPNKYLPQALSLDRVSGKSLDLLDASSKGPAPKCLEELNEV